MVTTIKQRVTVQPGGVVEVRSPELRAGTEADVTIQVSTAATLQPGEPGYREALASLMAFAGAVSGGDPHGSDNERIDADLARSYGATNDPA